MWSDGVNTVVRDETAAERFTFYHLPVFWHTSQHLVAKELLRPAPRLGLVPSELTALLFPQTTQYQSTPQCPQIQPVEVWCGSNEIVVRVDRFQLSAWPHPALYSLGSCQPTSVTSHFLFFHYPLTKCASASQVLASGQLVYSYALYYSPPLQGYIIRALPFTLPIHCYYKRFHYSYKVGYAPQVQHRTFKKSLGTKLSFSLNVCNAQWEPLPRGHSFVLGELINFVAQTGSVLPGEKLFVDSCYVTHTKDPNSTPKVDIITNYGWEELDAPLSICSCCDSTCGNMQDSLKNTVISPGWLTHQKNEEESYMEDSRSQSEERQDWVDQEELRKHDHLKKKKKFSSETEMEYKTSVFPGREVTLPRMSSTDKDWMEEGLPTTESQRTKVTQQQDVFKSREVASSAYNSSMSSSFRTTVLSL
ncbi:zona pellucida glycoprotein 3d tandem duplicate 1 isoform X3 [Syngnathoides biaculeatus]|uniref:zona pellucida glycoprotein 3d tandem duplicate 1 isoform X3 n=1 Tax=Syngnathoides biaculeatus TaxID=300417 RepID=UPI002ADD958E|nr:zona pellucida glycoprotein 3d tandem duplicate 1 isoform X3 [Syngnathoides biaculeatus]